MNIVHAASELFPFMKTGGLADAVGGLTHALAEAGHDVAVFLPGYRTALEHHEADAAQPALRVNRAASRLRLGDAQGAIADCEEALKALPPDVGVSEGIKLALRALAR